MTGLVLIAAGLFFAAIDFEGDFYIDLWVLWVLLVVCGAVLRRGGPLMASPEQDRLYSLVDMDVDTHTPAGGAALLGGSATPGGFRAPRGLNEEETDR